MNRLLILVGAVFCAGGVVASAAYSPLVTPTGPELLAQLTHSDVVVLAELRALYPCPGSGFATSYHQAVYHVEKVIMGTPRRADFVVGHALITGGNGMDAETGCLSPEAFKIGERFVILANYFDGQGLDLQTRTDIPTVFPSTAAVLKELARVVGDCTVAHEPPQLSRTDDYSGVPDELLEDRRTTHDVAGYTVDLRDSSGVGLVLAPGYLGRLGIGRPEEVIVHKIVREPYRDRVVVELTSADGGDQASLVGFIGKRCPPRILSPTRIPTDNGWDVSDFRASSPVWLNGSEVAFIGGSKDVGEKPWVYIENLDSGRVRSIHTAAPVKALIVKDRLLICVSDQGDIPLGLGERLKHSIVAK